MMPELGMDMFDMGMPPPPEPANLEENEPMQPQLDTGMDFPEMNDGPPLPEPEPEPEPAMADHAVADPAIPEQGMPSYAT